MENVTNKGILYFFVINFLLSLIYLFGMVAIYFSRINIESLLIGFYQMVFTIIHIIVLLLLMIIKAPKSKEYKNSLLYYVAGILAVMIGGWSYVKISILLNWHI
ncbi:hypothetical protein [Sediminibacterium sp. C3]|uniref:hypothetical protein n=1 Tax=Sediminibacterium sp. C3 TaxID=1267211 RepID=UPI0012698697|nr:hypothetical protein [Sediminibacterium sp. C3]